MLSLSTELLEKAEGRSEFIICVFADIRGFSSFSQRKEAPQIAAYVRRVYLQLLTEYFPNSTFCKPTGDGLLLVFSHGQNAEELRRAASEVLLACIRCLHKFHLICREDLLVNFEVPQGIGFGISRGTACCLHVESQILDYSGHILNLAARLMDLARPSGVVIDGNFDERLIPEALKPLFGSRQIFIRGMSEDNAYRAFYLKTHVKFPTSALSAPDEGDWQSLVVTLRPKDLAAPTPIISIPLPKQVRSKRDVTIRVQLGTKTSMPDISSSLEFREFRYSLRSGEPLLEINRQKLKKLFKRIPAKKRAITMKVSYLPKWSRQPEESSPMRSIQEDLRLMKESAEQVRQHPLDQLIEIPLVGVQIGGRAITGDLANSRLKLLHLTPSPVNFNYDGFRNSAGATASQAFSLLMSEIRTMAENLARFRKLDPRPEEATVTILKRLFADHTINHHQYSLARGIVNVCLSGMNSPRLFNRLDEVVRSAESLRDEFLNWLTWDPKVQEILGAATPEKEETNGSEKRADD